MKGFFTLHIIRLLLPVLLIQVMLALSGCAHIVPPEGGLRDTLPPSPVKSNPKDSVLNYSGNKITIEFNEFIELDRAFENVILSPNPNKQPVVESKLRTVTVKLKDSLLPNTTYSIDFGNAIKDINEGNILRDYKFVFSTGNALDTKELSGKVILAETGKVDSTLIVMLYTKLDDSAVAKQKPFYFTRLKGDGSFRFTSLPAREFALYALKDMNGNKQYDQKTELFAFSDHVITITDSTRPITLFAYAEEKETEKKSTTIITGKAEKKLSFLTNLESGRQSLIQPLEFTFSKPLKFFDTTKVQFFDSSKTLLSNYHWIKDSTGKQMSLVYTWTPGMPYKIIIDKDVAKDTLGNQLTKNDTLSFVTKKEEDYGSLRLKFDHLENSKNPVLQFVQQDKIVKSVSITDPVWFEKLVNPGEYELRILFDNNKNGKWDPGKFFGVHQQPEKILLLPVKITIKSNWENENTIDLKE